MKEAKRPPQRRKVTQQDIADIRNALDLGYDIAMDHKEPFEVAGRKADWALERIVTALFAKKP